MEPVLRKLLFPINPALILLCKKKDDLYFKKKESGVSCSDLVI
ncbi:hypothetical protein KIS1582_3698 [Cytobacillus firmus]|uniref:Uncharacterized protein n=1 Tax=Cytobacillus firmus TaxID=1399 RepID=A0A800MUD8_CYTFI|nr:hypothetical protein KIS1582_3698 [Cytobacillus firmus]